MPWNAIDDLSPDEMSSLVRLIHWAAIEGMKNAPEQSWHDYWSGSLETAGRTLAFLFAGSELVEGAELGIGDVCHCIEPPLKAAAKALENGLNPPGAYEKADNFIDEASVKFFSTFVKTTDAECFKTATRQAALRRQNERKNDSLRHERLRVLACIIAAQPTVTGDAFLGVREILSAAYTQEEIDKAQDSEIEKRK